MRSLAIHIARNVRTESTRAVHPSTVNVCLTPRSCRRPTIRLRPHFSHTDRRPAGPFLALSASGGCPMSGVGEVEARNRIVGRGMARVLPPATSSSDNCPHLLARLHFRHLVLGLNRIEFELPVEFRHLEGLQHGLKGPPQDCRAERLSAFGVYGFAPRRLDSGGYVEP